MEKVENAKRKFWASWCDEAPPEVRGRYVKGILWSMAAYAIVLTVSLKVLRAFPEASWRVAVALTPMVPMVFVLRV
jgi:hypothetical protein